VPLLVLTADRPPELRECRAGQAIDQQKLYGTYAQHFHELAVPVASREMLDYLRQAVAHAVERTQWPNPGPVHLNVPFRDPLAPVDDGSATAVRESLDGERFFAHLSPPSRPSTDLAAQLADFPASAERGLIVAGPAQPADGAAYAQAVAQIAQTLGWPVLADGLNPLRAHAVPGAEWHAQYNAVLRSPAVGARLRPDAILCLGEWPTSKQLRQWVAAADAPVWLLAEDARNHDALHVRTRPLRGPVESLARALGPGRREPTAYAAEWRRAEVAARQALAARLGALDFGFEGEAARLLSRHLPAGTPWMVANSMPVRDVEFFRETNGRAHQLYFNRGANGIDGTLSTACGIAQGGGPAVLLTGDLALLHDTNGFLLRPKLKGSLTVVLINNRGGGIFEMLPAAKFDPPFEEYFATPQEVDFARLCAAYGVEHLRVDDWGRFAELVAQLPASGVRVLEVRTDRKRDAACRRELFAACAVAVEAALAEPT
jgi:2-succinyl-5-enolpyruvyl-6-hydroxy-3-cyclohexene-1-carboxylate synthase